MPSTTPKSSAGLSAGEEISDGSWREPITSIGEKLEKDQLEYLVDSQTQQIEELQGEVERLRDWSTGNGANGDANIALSSLVRIVGDSDASTRQRIKAAAAILSYTRFTMMG